MGQCPRRTKAGMKGSLSPLWVYMWVARCESGDGPGALPQHLGPPGGHPGPPELRPDPFLLCLQRVCFFFTSFPPPSQGTPEEAGKGGN